MEFNTNHLILKIKSKIKKNTIIEMNLKKAKKMKLEIFLKNLIYKK